MDEKSFDTMNVIPLVDVMLVLLTIVLTTSTFIVTGALPVDLPKANQGVEEVGRGSVIEIHKRQGIFVDQKPVNIQELPQVLGLRNRLQPMLIRADRTIDLQLFVDVMEIVKGLGFKKVSLQTEAK